MNLNVPQVQLNRAARAQGIADIPVNINPDQQIVLPQQPLVGVVSQQDADLAAMRFAGLDIQPS